jgi:SAM-dependent methyltransferase
LKSKIIIILILNLLLFSCYPTSNNKPEVVVDENSEPKKENLFDSSVFELLVNTIEDPERKNWQNPELVIRELGNLEQKTVVDIGAGTGFFTFRIAPLAARVIAVDIDQRFLDVIEDRKPDFEQDWVERIETRLTVEDDPGIEENEADVVLIVNTFHFLTNRVQYLENVRKGMKEGGIILIVDFKQSDLEVAPPGGLIVPSEIAIAELRAGGFKNITVDQMSLKYQYIIKANS